MKAFANATIININYRNLLRIYGWKRRKYNNLVC